MYLISLAEDRSSYSFLLLFMHPRRIGLPSFSGGFGCRHDQSCLETDRSQSNAKFKGILFDCDQTCTDRHKTLNPERKRSGLGY